VKKGEVGLVGPAENEEAVKTLDKDVLLWEWKGRWLLLKSTSSAVSIFRPSSLMAEVTAMGDGEATPLGEVGEIPFGVCDIDGGFDPPSESSASEFFLDFDPSRLFFCLNFSSQLPLVSFRALSELPTVVAKKRALSLIIASVSGRPCF
jgi:hypothetical protein